MQTTSNFRDNTVWDYKNNVTFRDIAEDLSRAKVNGFRLADHTHTHISRIKDCVRVGQTLYTRGG